MTIDAAITLASNRGPVSFVATDDGFETKRGAGGLAGALDPVARRLGDRALWVAATTSDDDRKAVEAGVASHLKEELGYRVELLDIDPATYSSYYDEISNELLWFANHALWKEIEIEPADASRTAWENAYIPVNQRFAQSVAEVGGDDALVLFQDYHLSLAPAMLRSLKPDRLSFHFTHSSFAPYEAGLGHLPEPIARAVIEGMLGADLIGFHEPRWAANFFDCCTRFGAHVDLERGTVTDKGRISWVRCYPIPIDAEDLQDRATDRETQDWTRRHREWAGDRRLIVRADRMEPSKNIVRGFEAFGRLLDNQPRMRDEVAFLACVYPSRESLPEYQEYRSRIEEVVGRINSKHPDSIQLYDEDDFDRSLGALRIYDVLLVNPIMDGMNLVSMEGPALNETGGVLVLSRGAGSFTLMSEGAVINEDPLDVEQTAAAIAAALDLGDAERKERSETLRARAIKREPEDWIGAQLDDLTEIGGGNPPISPAPQVV